MENRKTVHPLYFHEDGTSALKAEVADTSCGLILLPGKLKDERTRMTDDELKREYDFYMAEKIVKKMLESGLISDVECTRISAENRRIFSPLLAELA